jgi:DNA-binding response OmpR family regulator
MAKTILIVDDDVDWVRILGKRLRSKGYHVEAAFDAAQAISRSIKLKPDLVLLDVLMPEGDGIGVLEKLRKNVITSDVPVMAVTGLADKRAEEMVTKLGVSEYFVKPVNMDKLLERIEAVLNRKEEEVLNKK